MAELPNEMIDQISKTDKEVAKLISSTCWDWRYGYVGKVRGINPVNPRFGQFIGTFNTGVMIKIYGFMAGKNTTFIGFGDRIKSCKFAPVDLLIVKRGNNIIYTQFVKWKRQGLEVVCVDRAGKKEISSISYFHDGIELFEYDVKMSKMIEPINGMSFMISDHIHKITYKDITIDIDNRNIYYGGEPGEYVDISKYIIENTVAISQLRDYMKLRENMELRANMPLHVYLFGDFTIDDCYALSRGEFIAIIKIVVFWSKLHIFEKILFDGIIVGAECLLDSSPYELCTNKKGWD